MKNFKSAVIKLDQATQGIPSRVQILKVGTFHHPNYGKFEITKEILENMVANFHENVRGIDIAIDYSHENEKEAAAWLTSLTMENEGTELWSEVRWTPKGQEKIENKEFRYTSSEFSLNYKDNESLREYGPTLLGVGLTNRPAVRSMEPIIQLSEYQQTEKEFGMDEKDKMIESLKAEIAMLKAKLEGGKEMEEMKKELEGKEMEAKELSEKNSTLIKENISLKADQEKLAKEKEFDLMLSEGKTCEAQRKSFIEGDMAEFVKNAQPIKLSQTGSSQEPKTNKGDAQDQVIALAEAKRKESGMDFSDAVGIVLSENPELQKKYYEEVNR